MLAIFQILLDVKSGLGCVIEYYIAASEFTKC